MYALITGASSGIGEEFAKRLNNEGYDLILVARSESKLNELKKELKGNIIIKSFDLSIEENNYKLINEIKDLDIKIFINNAGFGECGYILETSMEKEIQMLNLNVKALYILTKLALKEFNNIKILNIASIAGILPAGPYMAQYYGSKAYVRSFSESIAYELKKAKSNNSVHVLCPGPVKTNFDKNANVEFSLKGQPVDKCVSYTLKKLKKNKTLIIPKFSIKCAALFSRLMPHKMIIRIAAKSQIRKIKE